MTEDAASLPDQAATTWVDGPPIGLREWLALVFRQRAAPVRAVLVPTVPVAVVGALAALAVQLSHPTVVVNGHLDPRSTGTVGLVVGAVLLVVGVAALTLGAAAAGLLAVATVTGRARTVRWALLRALRRWPTLLAFVAIGVVLLVVPIPVVVVLRARAAPAWFAFAVAALVLFALYCPVCVAWPIALAEGRSPFAAIGRCLRVTHGLRMLIAVTALVFGYALPIGVVVGVYAGAGAVGARLPVWPWTLFTLAVSTALGVLVVTVAAAVHVGVLFSLREPGPDDGPHVARSPLDARRVHAAVADPLPEWRWMPRGRWGVATVVAAVLPGLLTGGLTWWNPAGAASYVGAEVASDTSRGTVRPVAMSDGSVTTVLGDSSPRTCRGFRCTAALAGDSGAAQTDDLDGRLLDLAGTGVTSGPGGRLVFSGWRTMRPATGGVGVYALTLFGCRPHDCTKQALERATPPTVERYEPGSTRDTLDYDAVRTAVTRTGRGYVVASDTASYSGSEVVLYHCLDARCAHPTRVVLGRAHNSAAPLEAGVLSLAVARDGAAAVTLLDPATGAVYLFTCGNRRCRHPARHTIAAPSRLDIDADLQQRQGAQVALLPDGRPLIAYHDAATGASKLVVCDDRQCSATTVRRLTGPGWAHPAPALAVDRAGRPLVVTYDLPAHELVLVSCTDTSCGRHTTVPLAGWRYGPGGVGMTLDADGHPVIGWTDQDPPPSKKGSKSAVRLIRCDTASCGATR